MIGALPVSAPPYLGDAKDRHVGADHGHPDAMEDLSHKLEQELAAAGVRVGRRDLQQTWVLAGSTYGSMGTGSSAACVWGCSPRSDIDFLVVSCRQVLEGPGRDSADPAPADLDQPTALWSSTSTEWVMARCR